MIPLKLHLRNFLSYGESVDTLDFSEFKLACLTGKNGSGKSSILDAITWAVWGEARKADFNRIPDPDLLRLSADEMTVVFSFMMNEHEYTVERGFIRGKKTAKSTLEFTVREDQDSHSRILTGNTKKDTQARIIETIGLDFRTFVNSSFLKQGKADEFTRQSPKDRKEILANILGLSFYDQMLEATKEQIKAFDLQIKTVQSQLAQHEKELMEEDAVIAKETGLKETLTEKDRVLLTVQERETKTQAELSRLQIEKERADGWKREAEAKEKQSGEYHARLQQLQKDHAAMQLLINHESGIEARHKRYEEINQQLKAFLAIDEQCKKLEKEKNGIERVIEQKRSSLQVQSAERQSEEKQLKAANEECLLVIQQEKTFEAAYKKYEQLLQTEKQYSESKPAFDNLQKQILEAESKIEQERQRLQTKHAELKGQTQPLQKLEDEINTIKQRLQTLSEIETQLKTLQTELETIEQKGQDARSLIDQCAEKINQLEKRQLEINEITHLIEQGSTEACPVCKQPLNEHTQSVLKKHYLDEQKILKKELQSLHKKAEEAKADRERLGQEYKAHKTRLDEWQKKISASQAEQNTLPQKEQELQKLKTLKLELDALDTQIRSALYAQDNRQHLAGYQQEIKALQYEPERHAELQKQIHTQRKAENDWNTLQEKKKQSVQYSERLQQLSQEILHLNQTIETQSYCADEKQAITKLDAQTAPLLKELDKRKLLYEEQEQLKNAQSEMEQLRQAKTRLPITSQEIENTTAAMQQLAAQTKELQQNIKNSETLLAQFAERNALLASIQTERKTLETARNQLYQELGSIEAQLKALQKSKEETKALLEQQDTIAKELRYFDILKKAFSRDGIPAMMVEQALPELEEDANRLLRRLTHGACTVRFQTQRESKTGDLKETLDILISDEMGTRDYDMFSGGEAFRTDLAVRIALSQLLCRRAGSRLQLLVIDEGFGTQDPEGLNNIVDAIDEIQDDFEKVLVVTHIEELKERFKDRIEVVKEPGIGSRFQIVHAL